MDPPALRHLASRLTGSLKADEVLHKAKAEWDVATIKALLLEVCQQPRAGQVVDMETSVCGDLKWEKMEPFNEYEPPAHSEAEVYGLELRGYLSRWNAMRKTLYAYKGQRIHREIFDEAMVKALGSCSDFRDLLTAVQRLAPILQNTAGWREE